MHKLTPAPALHTSNLEAMEVFSANPEVRKIEISFMQRFLQVSAEQSAEALAAVSGDACEQRFSSTFARMQNPLFARISRALEATVPQTEGFGKFRSRDE